MGQTEKPAVASKAKGRVAVGTEGPAAAVVGRPEKREEGRA